LILLSNDYVMIDYCMISDDDNYDDDSLS